MRILKSKILWLTLYAIGITGMFLFALFPSKLALDWVEAYTAASDYALKADALNPSLPLGFKFSNLTIQSPGPAADVLFQGEALDLQFNPLSLLSKDKSIYFKGRAYGGQFDGNTGFASLTKPAMPAEGKVSFKNLDLSRFKLHGASLIKGITGTAKGSLVYTASKDGKPGSSGKLSVYLTRGAYPLPEPFLGVSRIEYDRGELQAQLTDTAVKVDKFEFYGLQVNCFLTGDIQLAHRMDESRLNLKGTLEIAGKAKIKMNVTVGGTLASPSFRYI
ncbi:MAG TPA: type II secretion system protein GspN [Smithellaceae bacterium]|nr:type II secretion system protein GspN [Smithellaceae bacterium]